MTVETAIGPVAAAQPAPVDTRAASLRAIYIIWYRDILRYWRDRWRLVASLAQPLLFLVVFGSGLSSSLGGAFGRGTGISYIQFMYPGIIGMSILFSAIFGAMSIVWDREFGFLKEVLVAPIDRWAVAIGKALGGTTQAMIQGLILLVLAPFVGVNLNLLTVLELIPLAAILAFGLASFGVAIASMMKSLQGFQVVMNFLMMPMFFLSGALFPLTNLPNRPDPAGRAVEFRRAECRQPWADDQWTRAPRLAGGWDHARVRRRAPRYRGRHVSAPRLKAEQGRPAHPR